MVNFNVSVMYGGSCIGINQGNFIFSGPFNTVNVPWTCNTPTFTITPVNLTVQKDCQLLSTGEWDCTVTATQNFPGQVIIGGGSNNGNITIEPPELMLTSPGASMTGQLNIYLPTTSCPGTFSLTYIAASADSSNITGSITC